MDRLTARRLFDAVSERLALQWVAGLRGESRLLEAGLAQARRPSLVGYLNVIYPNKVQIIGSAELAWLDGLESRLRWETIQKIVNQQPVALVVSKDQTIPSDLREAAQEDGTPLWVSAKRGHELLTFLQFHLAQMLARRVTLHGVFLEIYSLGVLITGDPGTGKSELALELITRGHRLVADDAAEFTLVAPDVISGTCPEILQDLLEVRGLGVLNARQMFGHTAVKEAKNLRLIVHLQPPRDDDDSDGMKRLTGDNGTREVLDVPIPVTSLPVAPGRNLAVLTEAAVRSHLLKDKGIDPAQAFIDGQIRRMQPLAPW